MRHLLCLTVCFALVCLMWTGVDAQEKDKEVTLKGTITCPKCDLKLQKGCATVVVVGEGDAKKIYYFDKAGHKKHHGEICNEAKKGTVTGVVGKDEKDAKRLTITVSDVKFD